jgi:hypothetical protein
VEDVKPGMVVHVGDVRQVLDDPKTGTDRNHANI